MTRQTMLRHEYVEFIPEKLDPGCLYISLRFKTASHLCCCGCGSRVVTPLNPSKWTLTDNGDSVTLHPSIGNWSFPCKSHYVITHGRVLWAETMSRRQITKVQRRDKVDAERYSGQSTLLMQMRDILRKWFGM